MNTGLLDWYRRLHGLWPDKVCPWEWQAYIIHNTTNW